MSKSNNIRIDRGKVREAQKYDGKCVLETNDDTISMEDAASGYKGLMVIERCFRSLKRTQIKCLRCSIGLLDGSKPMSGFVSWHCSSSGLPKLPVNNLRPRSGANCKRFK